MNRIMNSMPRSKISLFASVVVALAAWSVSAQPDEQFRSCPAGAIEGTWEVRVTPPAETGVPPFDVFTTFTGNGGLVETNNAFPPPLASPGHGAWTRTGCRRFVFAYTKFRFTPQGQPDGTLKVRGRAILSKDGNSYTSADALAEFYDRNGNLLFASPSPGVAVRVAVQP